MADPTPVSTCSNRREHEPTAMTWSYRLCSQEVPGPEGPQTVFAVHEVFYDETGKVIGWTAEPVAFVGDDPEEVASSLRRALREATDRTVLRLPADG